MHKMTILMYTLDKYSLQTRKNVISREHEKLLKEVGSG